MRGRDLLKYNMCDNCKFSVPNCNATSNDILFCCDVKGEDKTSDNVIVCSVWRKKWLKK